MPAKWTRRAETYRHADEALLRPEAGTQAQFKKRRPNRHYRYDSSLSPALDWDGQNAARELGDACRVGYLKDGRSSLRITHGDHPNGPGRIR